MYNVMVDHFVIYNQNYLIYLHVNYRGITVVSLSGKGWSERTDSNQLLKPQQLVSINSAHFVPVLEQRTCCIPCRFASCALQTKRRPTTVRLRWSEGDTAEKGVPGSLLQAMWSLYNQSDS